jgi:diguanylate cyclase (GGDEF)-like protein
MNEKLRILLIVDDEDEYVLLKKLLSGRARNKTLQQCDLDWVATYEEAVEAFSACQYDLYLVDDRLGSRSGLDLLREPVVQTCSSPVIMLTGPGSYETDLAAMRLGTPDDLEKAQLTRLLLERSIRYAMERKQTEKHLERLVLERTGALVLMKKQAQELAALQKATSSLLDTLDLSRLMGQILDAAREAFPFAEQGWLYLVELQIPYGEKLSDISLSDPRIRRIQPPANPSAALRTLCKGRSLLIADTEAEPVLLSLLENEQERRVIRSAIIAPLMLDHTVIGALSLCASQPSIFFETDLQLLTSFAATATAAIHNAVLYQKTQDLASTDPLTGQLNRRAFFELGQRELERFQRFGHPLSWIMFDVDLFKEINDQYGHLAGDQVLKEIADRCCHIIRHVDIFGRYGGDEFVILLPETDQTMARDIADRIRTSIGESAIMTEAGSIMVTISIGVTQATQDTMDLGILLNKADQALYKSKRAGRNTITVSV